MTKSEFKELLQKEGYSTLHEYVDKPGDVFPDHSHEGDQKMRVFAGSIIIRMSGEETECRVGDEYFFPKGVVHSANVGSEGCDYIVGEKPSDES